MVYYLSLGANLGDREQTLREAIRRIEQLIGSVDRCSSFFYSRAWGFTSDHAFCNLCCRLVTPMAPIEVLRATQGIEKALGRTHKSTQGIYSDRTIDIDLIRAFDDEGKEIRSSVTDCQSPMSDIPLLTLPHPLWQERDFVRIPLAEIFP